jgi:carbohydrate-selective porin OprB
LNLPGNYRFYAWHNNADHTKWLDPAKTKESSYGFGLSFDQRINDFVTIFSRYGWQDPKAYNPEITAADGSHYSLEQSWSAGFQVEGKPWGRENDVFAFAVGQVMPSDDYKKSNSSLLAKTEGHLEAYYRIYVNKYLSVSPDIQYIWNPFGKDIPDNTSGIFVGGMRAQLDF